jgi:hypothetical protein
MTLQDNFSSSKMSHPADIKGSKISVRTLATQGRAAYLLLIDANATIVTGTFS